uniref:Uncharacterized protein n=1 Tax=Plectus sambesii TaxID=2011161 RepID=A0A914V2G8_9BILA
MTSSLRLIVLIVVIALLMPSSAAESCNNQKRCSRKDESCVNFQCLVPTPRSCAMSGTCPPGYKCKSGQCFPTRARRNLHE